MSDHYAQHGDVRKDKHVFGDVILKHVTFYGKASGSTRTPRHILYMYIIAAGKLKVLLGKQRLENGQLRGLLW